MSAFTMIWTGKRSEARPNSYNQICIACGQPVEPQTGFLVSKPNADGSAGGNGTIHADCRIPTDSPFRFRAMMGEGHTINLVNDSGYDQEAPEGPAAPIARNAPVASSEREPTEDELKAAAQEIVERTTDAFLTKVPDLVRQTLSEMTRTVEIKLPKIKAVTIKDAHKLLPDVVMCLAAGVAPFLVGPAGSGKTTLAKQAAEALGRSFYAENRVTSEYKLIGFMDATGKYVRTQFREAFEKGGVFLLDEVDASDPDVLTALNSALANDFFPFPDKMVKKHKDFVAIAAGNTYGRGADREYVGRNQLDAATLDRFAVIDIDYDEHAEMAWASDDDWTLYVQQVRKAIAQEKIRVIVSPRASIMGGILLGVGMDRDLVAERCIWKGIDAGNRARIVARMGGSL